MKLVRFSAYSRIQDEAECSNKRVYQNIMVFVLVLVIFINQNAKKSMWDTFIATLQLLPHHTPTIICIIIGSYIIFTLQNRYNINVYHVNQFLGAKVSLRLLEFILKQPKCFRKSSFFLKMSCGIVHFKKQGKPKFSAKIFLSAKIPFPLKGNRNQFLCFRFWFNRNRNNKLRFWFQLSRN